MLDRKHSGVEKSACANEACCIKSRSPALHKNQPTDRGLSSLTGRLV